LHEALSQSLAASLARARRMREVLDLEGEALGRRDLPALEQAAMEKERLIGLLEGLAAQQDALLRQAGLDPGRPDLDVALERLGHAECAAQSRELRAVLAECRHQNLVNGGVVETLRRFAHDVLDLMRGRACAPVTYSRRGAVRESGGGDPLATA